MPVPKRGMLAVAPVDEVLVMVSVPVDAPATVGSNTISSVTVWPVVKVVCAKGAESVNPVPITVVEFTVTAPVPVEVKITLWVEAVFSATLPNGMVVALMLSVGVAWLTVKVTDCVAVV